MRSGFVLGLAVSMLMASTTAAPPNEDTLDGVWQLDSGEADGKALTEKQLKGGKLAIKDAEYTVTLADIGTVTGTQKLGSTEKLKTIDITDASGPNKGKTCLGIYEVKGDEFRVVFASPGKARPSKFETLPDSGQWKHVWKRVQE